LGVFFPMGRGSAEGFEEFAGGDGGDEVVITTEFHHFLGKGFERGVAEEEETAIAAEFAKGANGGLGAAFHRLDGCQDGCEMVVSEFGDAVEEAGNGLNLSLRHGLRDGGIHLAIGVADEKNSLWGGPDHVCVYCISQIGLGCGRGRINQYFLV